MKLECAVQIVIDCLLTVSRDHDSINPDETLEKCGITTDFEIAYLKRLISNDCEIGVRSVKHELSPQCLAELNKNWVVMDLVILVRNCALIAPEAVIDIDWLVRKALKKTQPAQFNQNDVFHQQSSGEKQLLAI